MTDFDSEGEEKPRPSLYLLRKADALLGALRFFDVGSGDTTRRRLQFLAQSDFWEWEIDNLIYLFTNLAERSETWRSPKSTAEKLGRMGISVKSKALAHVGWRNTKYGLRRALWNHSASTRTHGPTAPIDALAEVIDTWNRLLDAVESQFLSPMRRDVERWNVQTRTDLAGMKKSMPKIESAEA